MSLDTFAREHLGFMPKKAELQNYAIPAAVWDSCASAMPKPDGKTAYGVKFTADGAKPVTEPLPPLKEFLKDRIMDRMKEIDA